MHKSGEGLVVMNRGSKKRPTGLKGGRRKKGVQVALPRAEETRGAVLCTQCEGPVRCERVPLRSRGG